MGFAISAIRKSRRRALRAFGEIGLVAFGVAVVVIASAVLGIAVPQAMSADRPAALAGGVDRAPVKRLPRHSLLPLLGKELHSTSGADIGQVAGVLVDGASKPRAVIVNYGGFLGIGVRKVAVDWQALRFSKAGTPDKAAERGKIVTDLRPEQLAHAPQYKPASRSIAVVTAPRSDQNAPTFGYAE